ISSILLYFQNKHNLEDLRYLPKSFKINQTKDIFGFEFEEQYWARSRDKYFSHTVAEKGEYLDIIEYDYFIDYTYYGNIIPQKNIYHILVYYYEENRIVEIQKHGKSIYNKNIDYIVNIIHKNNIGEY